MKKLLDNIKPIAAYWLSIAIFYISYFAADFDFITNLTRNQLADVFFYVSFSVFCILIGRFLDLRSCKAGLIVFAVQLVICSVLCVFNIFYSFAGIGNYMFSAGPFQALFHYSRSGWQYLPDFIFSIVFPFLLILIGQKIRAHYKNAQL